MFSYGITTSYLQRPYAMTMSYSPTFQSSPFYSTFFSRPSFLANFSQYSLRNTYNSSSRIYTPTLNTSNFVQLNINPSSGKTSSSSVNRDVGTLPGTASLSGNSRDISFVQLNLGTGRKSARDTVNKALQLAHAEIGTRENGNSNDSKEVRKYKNGKIDDSPWCTSFVSWLYGAGQGSDNSKTFGYAEYSQTVKKRANDAGHFSSKNSGYKPKRGDIMVIQYADGTGHLGIVDSEIKPDGTFETIEGNSGNKVRRVQRDLSNQYLEGFVRMEDWLEAA